ncbi:3-ketosteroid-9-alpha-hydroxylase [Pseudomonas sp. G11-1]|nr:3-ketosteroid-9-alpha-hydroxylase [Pseudomonas sp. G11-1]MCO5788645.1 3-ketosteroid-9-alpha-hydroxylase [Pseudomonas sp. G11-2]
MIPYSKIDSENPTRYARGWHCFGLERDIKKGEIKSFDAFGSKIVAYRGEDNQIRVFNAFCPHMGADLSIGTVKGNNLECPFHSWQWGDGGACKHIPYADRIPPKARLKEWPTHIENELLFIWHDHEELPPIDNQKIPPHRSSHERDWSDWTVISRPANSNCRELIDNLADVYHFEPVHGSPVSSYINVSEGHNYCQMLTGGNQLIGSGDSLSSVAFYHGPSYVIADMEAEMWGHKIVCIMLIGSVPISQNKFMMHFGMKVKAVPELSFSENQKLMAEYIANGQETFFQDLRIWDTKKRVNNPVLCSGDGPVYQLREWYDQFYIDRADVPESVFKKKVFVSRQNSDTENWIRRVHNCDLEGNPLPAGSSVTKPMTPIHSTKENVI